MMFGEISFNSYNVIRLEDMKPIGSVELPARHFCELKVFRSGLMLPVNVLLVPSVTEREAAIKRHFRRKR